MTLIIALVCKDAIILGSDSKATEEVVGHLGFDPSFPIEKISSLGNFLIWGGSGETGFILRARDRLEADFKGSSGKYTKTAIDVCAHMRTQIVEVAKIELANMVPPDPARLKRTRFLFCGYSSGTLWINEIIGDGTATRYEQNPGFHAIGSAAHFAWAAFSLLRHHGVGAQDERAGLIVAHRILDSSVRIAAGGVGEPLRYWVLNKTQIRQPLEDEVRNVKETVGLWSEMEKESLSKALSKQ